MVVIELNLPISPTEFSQMGDHFQHEHRLAKMVSHMGEQSPIWEKTSQVERAPLLFVMPWVVHV